MARLSRAELDRRLRRADEARLALRRATRELVALGERLRKGEPRAEGRRSEPRGGSAS